MGGSHPNPYLPTPAARSLTTASLPGKCTEPWFQKVRSLSNNLGDGRVRSGCRHRLVAVRDCVGIGRHPFCDGLVVM